jgi:hypothetical protein
MRAGRDRDLVLARQVEVLGIAVEEVGCLLEDGRRVERFIREDSLQGTAGDIAHGIAASPRCGESGLGQVGQDVGHVRQTDEVELDVLASGELREALAVLDGNLADRPQALGWEEPAGNLDAEHEAPHLRLVVVHAVPLQPDDVLLGDVEVMLPAERIELVEDEDWGLLLFHPLDGVAFEDLFPGRLGRQRTLLARPVFPVVAHALSPLSLLSIPPATAKAKGPLARPSDSSYPRYVVT